VTRFHLAVPVNAQDHNLGPSHAAVRHAQQHSGGPWRAIAAAALLLATAAVSLVLVRTLRSAASRRA